MFGVQLDKPVSKAAVRRLARSAAAQQHGLGLAYATVRLSGLPGVRDLRREESPIVKYRRLGDNPTGTAIRRADPVRVKGHGWRHGESSFAEVARNGIADKGGAGHYAVHGCTCGVQHEGASHEYAARNRHLEHLLYVRDAVKVQIADTEE